MDANYKIIKLLGQGGFGRVHLCEDRKKRHVCIKEIPIGRSREAVKKEAYILSQLNHPRIIKFIGSYQAERHYKLILEYAPQGSLRSFLNQRVNRPLKREMILNIFQDILMGLEYLHIRHVIHRDLKPENLLISKEGRIKICDFGISAVYARHAKITDNAGTVLYLAPEILKGGKCEFIADIWSLGCVYYELCLLRSPFIHFKTIPDILSFMKTDGTHVSCALMTHSEDMKYLGRRMLTYDPVNRITLRQIIRNPLITLNFYNMYFEYYDY